MADPVGVLAPPDENHDHISLDVVERQILCYYEDDPHFEWHHRLLLISLGGSRWLVATPTLDVHQEDFDGVPIRALARQSRFPLECRPAFAFGAMTQEVLDGLRMTARTTAEILGVEVPVAAISDGNVGWFYSDPASLMFGQEVAPATAADAGRAVHRGSCGLVEEPATPGAAIR